MPEISTYLHNRAHSDAEYAALIEQVEKLEAQLEYVAMMTDVELPEDGAEDV